MLVLTLTMQNWLNQHPEALLILAPAFVVAVWMMVPTLIASIGGWTALAARFRCRAPLNGVRWKWQSGQMRWIIGYNNCLTVGCNGEGLYLAMIPLFAFRHPPLLIPWNEIQVSRRRFLWADCVRFELGSGLDIPLLVRQELGEKLKVAAGDRWPVERMA